MPVYVDNHFQYPSSRFGRMKMSHLIADTDEELEAFARILGLKREWKHNDHYDISINMRQKAIEYGAQKITLFECSAMSALARRGLPMGDPRTAEARRKALTGDTDGDREPVVGA